MIIFETERLIVRPFQPELDADNFFAVNGDEEVMRYIRRPKTKEECDVYFKETIDGYAANPLMGRWAVEEKNTGVFVGSFAFLPVEKTNDSQLGYALLKEYWGKGFATELMREGIRYVFTKTRLDAVYAITEVANMASQKVLLKVGMALHKSYKENGKDVCCFKLLRADLLY